MCEGSWEVIYLLLERAWQDKMYEVMRKVIYWLVKLDITSKSEMGKSRRKVINIFIKVMTCNFKVRERDWRMINWLIESYTEYQVSYQERNMVDVLIEVKT